MYVHHAATGETTEMNKSESIAKLALALSKAQKAIKGATKDGKNPHFNSHFATLASIWDACREALTANELAIVQTTDDTNDGLILETTLMHSSGEWISGRLSLKPVKTDPQGIGSAITYGRRYALAAIVGVAPEDDDGEAASRPQNTAQAKGAQAASPKKPTAGPRSVEKRREELEEDVAQVCKLLNAAGDEIKWTKLTLTDYIAKEFEVDDGLDSLSGDYLDRLLGKLNLRLDRLNSVVK